MGAYDFKPRERDGPGLDWPMKYEDLTGLCLVSVGVVERGRLVFGAGWC